MFFRKKEKEEVPVIGGHKQRPPVPPKRTILPNANNKTNQTESNHKLESTDEHASIYDTPKPPKFTIAGGDSDEASTARVLEVKSVPELAEFCDRKNRQSGARDDGDQLMLGHINTNLHEFSVFLKDIPEEQRYWLIHKGGYTMVRLVEHLPDGRAMIKVAGREMTVDSTDIDRMNPTQLDRVGDIAALRYLNETSTVHLLRQRHGSNLLYTNAGLTSIVCVASAEEGAIGQDRLVSLFKGCRRGQMPAHVYATAQQVYR
ncbi:hypothetical protein ANCCEY_10506 [Ancylostoma ceylanicum]|uniref:Myosin motor domain-containing protein n=1 Tax=Ancylostoma ceylanicum TaxID=53326 RepID=A0A0D6LGU3_9BILA|nr:hypothetical protein ANCCEY_10506 [Ancylostoma ceylanicum]